MIFVKTSTTDDKIVTYCYRRSQIEQFSIKYRITGYEHTSITVIFNNATKIY